MAVFGVGLVVAGLGVVLIPMVCRLPCVGLDGLGERGRWWPSLGPAREVIRSSTLGKLPSVCRASASVRRWEQGASGARVKRCGMLTIAMTMLMLMELLLPLLLTSMMKLMLVVAMLGMVAALVLVRVVVIMMMLMTLMMVIRMIRARLGQSARHAWACAIVHISLNKVSNFAKF